VYIYINTSVVFCWRVFVYSLGKSEQKWNDERDERMTRKYLFYY